MPTYPSSVKDWKDKPDTSTPITAAELERIEGMALDGVRAQWMGGSGSFTLAAAQENSIIAIDAASAATVTIPTNASVPLSNGTTIQILQWGTGLITIAAQGGVTVGVLGPMNTVGQYGVVTLIKRSTDTWLVIPPPRPVEVISEAAYQSLGANAKSSTVYLRTP